MAIYSALLVLIGTSLNNVNIFLVLSRIFAFVIVDVVTYSKKGLPSSSKKTSIEIIIWLVIQSRDFPDCKCSKCYNYI